MNVSVFFSGIRVQDVALQTVVPQLVPRHRLFAWVRGKVGIVIHGVFPHVLLSSTSFLEDDFLSDLRRRVVIHVLEFLVELVFELCIEVVVEGCELFLFLDFVFLVGDHFEHAFVSFELVTAGRVVVLVVEGAVWSFESERSEMSHFIHFLSNGRIITNSSSEYFRTFL